jgi:hypothetical protein
MRRLTNSAESGIHLRIVMRIRQYRLFQIISIPFEPLLLVVLPIFQLGATSYSTPTSRP